MNLSQSNHDIFIPDSLPVGEALPRTTHLGIGAHQDDLEFMALHGILECYQSPDRWFGGITCTDGAGSARTGPYSDYSNEQMKAVRIEEQKAAATLGEFGFVAQLGHPPAHIGVLLATIAAIHELPRDTRPKKLFGCEVWRALDWLPDSEKTVHDVSAHPDLATSLNRVFDSQIAGGKRYDLAVEGRRLANATFFDAHSVDEADRVQYATDLSSLISGENSLRNLMNEKLDLLNQEIFELLDEIST